MKKNILLIAGTALFSTTVFMQCKSNDDSPTPSNNNNNNAAITDNELYNASTTTSGFTYYKSDNTVTTSSPESAHTGFFRVRFNDVAFAALTDNGKLPAGSTFPEGSLIVKELHNQADGSDQSGVAIMIKRPNDPNADANGWVWAEYFSGPNTGFSVSTKGAGCTGCHGASGNRDQVRLFALFP